MLEQQAHTFEFFFFTVDFWEKSETFNSGKIQGDFEIDLHVQVSEDKEAQQLVDQTIKALIGELSKELQEIQELR